MSSAASPGDWDFDVLVSGMVFLDIVFTGLPHAPSPGTEVWTGGMGSSPGGIANLAVATARLGLRTSLAAGFGDDGYADWCRRVLADQEGVDLSLSQTFEHWHTPVTVSLAYDGDRAMVTHGHPAPLTSAQLIGMPPRTRAVVVELEDEPWWLPAKAAGSLVFADVGWDPTGAWHREVLDRLDGCHCFMPNDLEAQAYTRTETPEAALASLAELVPMAVVTSGCRGAIAVDGSTGERASVPSVPATALDPTGAGDVFGASLVVGTLAGWPLVHRLQFAALCASLAVRQFGGALAAPGWGDLADWWTTVSDRAAAGDPTARDLRTAYGFLPDVLPAEPAKALRRAEATIARLSDLPSAAPRATRRRPANPRPTNLRPR
ncbi:MAG: PfkB family carbohydrate kinase [Cellulomonas sp.]